MILANITRHDCSDNIGSIKEFYFVPLVDVSAFPYHNDILLLGSVTLITGKTWYKAQVAHNSGSIIEEDKPSPQGTSWLWKITGIIHKDTYDKALNLYNLDNLPILVQCVDSNGVRRLLGDMDHPLLLTQKHATGTQYTGTNQRVIDVKGEAPHPAYYFGQGAAEPVVLPPAGD